MALEDYIFNSNIKKIKIDFPSGCNANCIGCYTHSSEKDPSKKLPLETVRKVLSDASEIGVKQLVIAADGEPLIDKNYFFQTVEYAKDLGIETILYTNGSLVTEDIANKLFNLGTSVLVKRNSMDHDKQNHLLRANLSVPMFEGLENLLKAGFNSERLAIESFVSKENYTDLNDVLRYCRKNDILPYFEEFISLDQEDPEIKEKMLLSTDKMIEAFKQYQKIDREEFGIDAQVFDESRRYNIPGCSLKQLLSIDTDGNVKKCILNEPYGNVYQNNLKEIYGRIPNSCNGCSNIVKVNSEQH
jgi:MoaA/NifB/PqqE/SkfB family radical SAM enzyme